jgi:predicted ATPase
VDILRFLKHAITPPDETVGVSSFDRAVIQLGGPDILDKTVKRPATVKFEFGIKRWKFQLKLLVQDKHRKPIIDQENLKPEGPLTIENLQRQWQEVLNVVRSRNLTLEALLSSGKPLRIEENNIILGFTRKFNRDRVEEETNKQTLEDTLSEVLGQQYQVQCVMSESEQPTTRPEAQDKIYPLHYYKCHDQESGKGVVSVYEDQGKSYRRQTLNNVPVDELALVTIPTLIENSQFPPEDIPVYKTRRELMETISRWHFYNANHMNLKQILESEPKIGRGDRFLSPAGDNLAIVLHNLMEDSLDFEEKINNAMKAILPTTRRLRTVLAGQLSVTTEWYVEDVEEPFFLHEMSDGSVRMLCWATTLHSPKLPQLLVIEEPEIGIHTAWLKILAEWMKAASRQTQIIISTHSPDLLDCFTEQVIAETANVFVFNAKDKNHFVVESLSKEAITSWVQKGWELGDLYRVGDPSIGGWPW